jgi:hypothetical protein
MRDTGNGYGERAEALFALRALMEIPDQYRFMILHSVNIKAPACELVGLRFAKTSTSNRRAIMDCEASLVRSQRSTKGIKLCRGL